MRGDVTLSHAVSACVCLLLQVTLPRGAYSKSADISAYVPSHHAMLVPADLAPIIYVWHPGVKGSLGQVYRSVSIPLTRAIQQLYLE